MSDKVGSSSCAAKPITAEAFEDALPVRPHKKHTTLLRNAHTCRLKVRSSLGIPPAVITLEEGQELKYSEMTKEKALFAIVVSIREGGSG